MTRTHQTYRQIQKERPDGGHPFLPGSCFQTQDKSFLFPRVEKGKDEGKSEEHYSRAVVPPKHGLFDQQQYQYHLENLEMQILMLHSRPTESDVSGRWAQHLWFNQPYG